MSYYSYHNRLKQLLETESYIGIPETGKFAYRFIFPRLIKEMPIRDYRMEEYEKWILKTENM